MSKELVSSDSPDPVKGQFLVCEAEDGGQNRHMPV